MAASFSSSTLPAASQSLPPVASAQTASETRSAASSSALSHRRPFPAVSSLEKGRSAVETGQQFLEWLHQVENSLQFQEDEPYRLYIERLERHKGDADGLLEQVG